MNNENTTNTTKTRGRPALYNWASLLKSGDSLFVSNPKPGVPSAAFSWAKRRGFKVSTESIIENEIKGLKITRIN